MAKLQSTCSSCVFFEHSAHPVDGKPHASMGHKPYGKACSFYEANPFLVKETLDELEVLRTLINKLPPSARESLASLINSSGRLEKYGFKFMQKVAYMWRGGSNGLYINNFAFCYVMSVSKDGKEVRLISKDRKIGVQCPVESVHTLPAFNALREKLLAENRIKDPSFRKGSNIMNRPSVPHIDSIAEIVADFMPRLQFLTPSERKSVKAARRERQGKPTKSFTVTSKGDV